MRRFAAIAIVGLLVLPLSSHALVFADAEVRLVRSAERAVVLAIRNTRRCWLRHMRLSVSVSGVRIDPVAVDDLEPGGKA